MAEDRPSLEAQTILSSHDLHNIAGNICLHHCLEIRAILLDSGEGVYLASSASQLGNCRYPTSLMLTERHGLKRLHHGSASVAQVLQRVWTDNFRQDPPMSRPIASRSRCLGNRLIWTSKSIVDTTTVYVTIHLLMVETSSKTWRSFAALTIEEVPVAGPHSNPFQTRLAFNCWISMIFKKWGSRWHTTLSGWVGWTCWRRYTHHIAQDSSICIIASLRG